MRLKITAGSTALVAAVLVSLAACGSASSGQDGSGTSSSEGSSSSQPSQDASSGKSHELQIAHEFSTDSAVHKGLLEANDWLKKESDGRLSFHIYANSSFGGKDEMAAALKSGQLFADPNGLLPEKYDPAGALYGPYVFPNWDSWNEFAASDNAKKLLQDYSDAAGEHVIGLYNFGYRDLATKGFAVNKPEDMQGKTMRVVTVPPYSEMNKVLNANGTPVPIEELYLSLKTGVVDATANPPSQMYERKLYEVTDHLILTQHMISPGAWSVSKKVEDELGPEDSKLAEEAIRKASAAISKLSQQEEEGFLKKLEDKGMTIVKPDISAFEARAHLVTDNHPAWKPIIEQIQGPGTTSSEG
jgi:TRAP-type C4-dicarboxylate transport system substrate-binding protein